MLCDVGVEVKAGVSGIEPGVDTEALTLELGGLLMAFLAGFELTGEVTDVPLPHEATLEGIWTKDCCS
jgi:hypothetical protein